MVSMRRILRDYRDAGSVNSLLAVVGLRRRARVFDEGRTCRAGVSRARAATTRCLDSIQRRDIVHRFEAALRLLDESCRVYQYSVSAASAPIEAAPCSQRLVHEAVQRRAEYLNDASRRAVRDRPVPGPRLRGTPTPHHATSTQLRGLLRDPRRGAARLAVVERRASRCSKRDLDRAVAQLYHKAAAFEVQLADHVRPAQTPKADAFRFFRRLVNYAPAARRGRGTPVRHARGLLRRRTPRWNATAPIWTSATCGVKVLTMKEPPAATFAHLLEDLYTVPGECIACLEWQRIPNDRMRRDLQTPAAALLQQARVARELRRARHAARGNARR